MCTNIFIFVVEREGTIRSNGDHGSGGGDDNDNNNKLSESKYIFKQGHNKTTHS
jgi:hypothetical protein